MKIKDKYHIPGLYSYITLLKLKNIADDMIKKFGEDASFIIEEQPYDGGYQCMVEYEREETERETKQRLSKKKQQESWERQQYEQLKKKFEDNKS